MTASTVSRGSIATLFRTTFPEPVMALSGVMLLLLALPTGAAVIFDETMLQGQSIWLKTLRFQLSLAIYLLTLSAYARWLPSRFLADPRHRLAAWLVVVAGLIDLVAIAGPAAAGVPAHFAEKNRLLEAGFAFAGFFALLITTMSAVYGILIADSDRAPRSPAFRTGLVLGLVLSFALTLVVTGYIVQTGGHLVMGISDEGGLFFFGWSRVGGDLRVAHFFGLHAMHAVPLAGWMADRLLPGPRALVATLTAACVYVILSLWVFAQALMGLPFFPALG